MMKKLLSLFLFFFLVGCSNQNEETLENIEQAIEKNESLRSGTFERIHIDGTEDESLEQKSTGAFIKNGEDESTWYVKTIINTANETDYMERVKVDGKVYDKMVVANEEYPWTQSVNLGVGATLYEIEPLFDYDELQYVDSIETNEVDGMTHYKVTFTEESGDSAVKEAIEALEEDIERQKEIGTPEEVIDTMEMRVEEMKEIVYSDMVNTYIINQEGYLIEVHFEFTQTAPDRQALSSITKFILTDYNLDNTEDLIPEI